MGNELIILTFGRTGCDIILNDKFTRHQFPIRTCFAMIVNKSQGQTLSREGLVCSRDFFLCGYFFYIYFVDCCDMFASCFFLHFCCCGLLRPDSLIPNLHYCNYRSSRLTSLFDCHLYCIHTCVYFAWAVCEVCSTKGS